MAKLFNHRHELMAQGLFKGLSEVDAYRKAGYRGNPRRGNACRMSQREDIRGRVAELNSRIERAKVVEKQEAIEMLSVGARSAFSFFRRAGRVGRRGISISVAELNRDPELKAAVREFVVSEDRDRVTVKLHDFSALLGLLAKLEGWEAPTNINLTRRSIEELTDDELLALDGRHGPQKPDRAAPGADPDGTDA